MDDELRRVVDADWETRLGISHSVLRSGGVHVVVGDLGANDAMSVRLDDTCIVVVRAEEDEEARAALAGLDAQAAFTAGALHRLVGLNAQVDGPSCHSYANQRTFLGAPDVAVQRVDGNDVSLLAFLERNDVSDRAESGFPPDLSSASQETCRYRILREEGRVVAAGNMTDWRGMPADVGVLTDPVRRCRGLGGRLVGSMVADALWSVGVVRYRALDSNSASLVVARRLGFETYGLNFRARRRL